jgi:S-adenosylmethionine hydrolase
VHLAVVDPGVGSERRPILAEAGGHLFVAPDNGLLTQVLRAVSEPVVREISATRFFREPVSRTFHGRDVFAPVAAHLAAGVAPDEFGSVVDDWLVRGAPEPAPVSDTEWVGEVLWVDHFGNVVTNLATSRFADWLAGAFALELSTRVLVEYAAYYSSMKTGLPYVTKGSAGFLEVSLNQGDAARALGVRAGCPVRLIRRGTGAPRTGTEG